MVVVWLAIAGTESNWQLEAKLRSAANGTGRAGAGVELARIRRPR